MAAAVRAAENAVTMAAEAAAVGECIVAAAATTAAIGERLVDAAAVSQSSGRPLTVSSSPRRHGRVISCFRSTCHCALAAGIVHICPSRLPVRLPI